MNSTIDSPKNTGDPTWARCARKLANRRQADVAREAGIPRAELSRIELGRELPRESVRARLAAVLDVDPAILTESPGLT